MTKWSWWPHDVTCFNWSGLIWFDVTKREKQCDERWIFIRHSVNPWSLQICRHFFLELAGWPRYASGMQSSLWLQQADDLMIEVSFSIKNFTVFDLYLFIVICFSIYIYLYFYIYTHIYMYRCNINILMHYYSTVKRLELYLANSIKLSHIIGRSWGEFSSPQGEGLWVPLSQWPLVVGEVLFMFVHV